MQILVICNYCAQASRLRILPLGDSLTIGPDSVPGGYRGFLHDKLKSEGYTIEYLGNNQQNSPSYLPGGHESHPWSLEKTNEYIGELLEDLEDPDIILLIIGTHDMTSEEAAQKAVERWDDLLLQISFQHPFAHILTSNLPTREYGGNVFIKDIFNPQIRIIADSHREANRKVSFVDMRSILQESEMETDIQPNEAGYMRIAETWYDCIQNITGGPGGDLLPTSIIRVTGSSDRHHIDITFSKPVNKIIADWRNFDVSDSIEILGSQLQEDERTVTLKTSELDPGHQYSISLTKHTKERRMISGGLIENVLNITSSKFTVGWRFINLSDWHSAEKYIFRPNEETIEQDITILKHLKGNYGGDFIMIPGDTNSGSWDRTKFHEKLEAKLGKDMSPQEVVLEGGKLCYSGMLSTFRSGGYSNVLVAFGDHEGGDNPWPKNELKSELLPSFRQTFAESFNLDYDGSFRYDGLIGNVISHPKFTDFENTSYAYIHMNALIIVIDCLHQTSAGTDIGPAGTVAGRVEGEHLKWFENILAEAKELPTIKHIFVHSHFPVLYPVRKSRSSGQMMDFEAKSPFWKAMQDNNVDIYFAGEVHLNTVIKDPDSSLIQISSRGNHFTSFLTIDVTDDTIAITSHSEKGDNMEGYNLNYSQSGKLLLQKMDGNTNVKKATGELSLLNRSLPVIHFSFENITPLESRPILSLGLSAGVHPDDRKPVVKEVTISGILCDHSLPNVGSFGMPYDAQISDISLVDGVHGSAGMFGRESRAAVWGMGPHTGGNTVSYALWFNTQTKRDALLIVYEGFWAKKTEWNLKLSNGTPQLVYSFNQMIIPRKWSLTNLNDGNWHHIAVVMPKKDCLLSEVIMYINGEIIETRVMGDDSKVYIPNGGLLSLGGFGHGRSRTGINDGGRQFFTKGRRFLGLMDDAQVWSRSLSTNEVFGLAQKPVSFSFRNYIRDDIFGTSCLDIGDNNGIDGLRTEICNNDLKQSWQIDSSGYVHSMMDYSLCMVPENGARVVGTRIVMVDCGKFEEINLKWRLTSNNGIAYEGENEMEIGMVQDDWIVLVPSYSFYPKWIRVDDKGQIVRPHPGTIFDPVSMGLSTESPLASSEESLPLPSLPSTTSPTKFPSESPSTVMPTKQPSKSPSTTPTKMPSGSPSTIMPTNKPSESPSQFPTTSPTVSLQPSEATKPSYHPSNSYYPTTSPKPSLNPTDIPTNKPSSVPSAPPTSIPSSTPSTSMPTHYPSMVPSLRKGKAWDVFSGLVERPSDGESRPNEQVEEEQENEIELEGMREENDNDVSAAVQVLLSPWLFIFLGMIVTLVYY